MFKIKDVKENILYTNKERHPNIICFYSYKINKIVDDLFNLKIHMFIILLPSYRIEQDDSYETTLSSNYEITALKEATEEDIRIYNYCKENYVFK